MQAEAPDELQRGKVKSFSCDPAAQRLGFFPRPPQVLPNSLYFPYMQTDSICIRFFVFRLVSMSFGYP